MKKFIYLLGFTLFFSFVAQAQNEGISFQGLARNAAGEVLVSQTISLRLSILLGSGSGTVAYTETRQTTTNPQGIFAVVVGDGTANSKSGNFSNIDWGTTSKFIKVEMDPNAGLNFTTMGTSKLQPVPFAFYAYGVDAENVEGILPVTNGGTGVTSISDLKTNLGVDQVNNTSDANKPISAATQGALNTKVDKENGKGLSSNDYTTAEKIKLAAITGTNTGDQDLSTYATTTQLDSKANAADVTASLSTKVDKENGKGLSSNDYTTAEKIKLAAITGNVAGPQGIQGLPGAAGVAGATGATGPQGLPGAVGATGPAGPQGLPGAAGPTGNDGAVGPQGATGPAGLPGQAGAAGVAGPAGPRGLPGSTGAAGAQGQPGVAGPVGSDGAIGAAGPRGLQGPTGPAGTNGISASSANFVDLTTDQTILGVKTFSGNIGLGTSTPSAKLEIVGGTRNDMLRLVSDGNPSVSFKNTDPSGGTANDGEYQLFAAGNSGNPSINPGTFGIYYDHSSNAGYRMAITNTGNVGVGTAKPTEKLDVVGNVKSSGTLTVGTVTYPNIHGSANQVLSTTGTGTLAWTTPASGGVPYTGATQAVNLEAYDLKVNGVTVGKGLANIVDNTAVGFNALNSASSSGGGNSAFGYQALQANTTGGNNNSAFGTKALMANTTGYSNTAIGASSLLSNTTGFNNISVNGALTFNTSGNYNIGIGLGALQQNKIGSTNIAIGREAGFHLNSYNFSSGTGSGNIFIGYQSGISRNRGSNNTAIGQQSLYSYTGDFYDYSNAVAIGIQSGFTNQTNNNTFLGSFADVDYTLNSSITNATAVGYKAKVIASNTIQLGADGTAGSTAITNVKTTGTLTAGTVTYPNTHGSANQVLSTTGSGTLAWTAPATSSAHYIGEAYGGGIVFYIWDNGAHGLIAATSDQGAVRWGANLSSTRARADGVGAGLTNTAIIIAKQGTVDSNLIAASLCNEYAVTSGGVVYGGWYLPSKHELQLLFNQKNMLTGLTGDWYYSSTESASGDGAWLINGNGSSSSWWPNDKREAWSVRAIRAF
jgi:hypothetical protein